jgi:hypothetical protein
MSLDDIANACLPSTTYAWKRVRIPGTPERARVSGSEATSSGRFSRTWPRRDPLTLTIKYRGGSEGWYEVRARGRVFRRPGWVDVETLMRDVYGESSSWDDPSSAF